MLTHGSGIEISDGGTSRAMRQHLVDGPVLIPVFTDDVSPQVVDLAIDIAEYGGTDLFIVGLETVPDQTPLDHPEVPIESDRWVERWLQRARDDASADLDVSGATRVGRTLGRMIHREVEGHDIQTLVLEETDETAAEPALLGNPIDSIFESVECDVVLATGTEHLEDISTILVPIAGGPHSGMAVDVAKAIATENDAWIEFFHVIDPHGDEEERQLGEQYIEAATDRLGDFENVDTWIYEAPDIAEAIIEQTQYYSLTILGAPQKGRLKRFLFGSKTETISERAKSTVLTVRSTETERNWFESWLGRTD